MIQNVLLLRFIDPKCSIIKINLKIILLVVVDEESLEPDNFSENQDISVHENIGDIEDIKIEMEELENTVNKDLEDIKEEAEITGLKQGQFLNFLIKKKVKLRMNLKVNTEHADNIWVVSAKFKYREFFSI